MSRSADDPRPPKRPRPGEPGPPGRDRPKSTPRLPAPTEPDDLGASTFRPNPARLGGLPPTEEETAPERSTFRPGEKSNRPGQPRPKKDREPKTATGGPTLVERIVFGRVSTGHLAMFCRQLGAYLDAGVPIVRAIDSLQSQFARTALGPVLERVAVSVRRGDSLSDAMGREPGAFDTQFLAMMAVAEARGGVPEVMKRMASGYEARQRLFRQARSAMIYPIAVISIAFGVGMLLTVFVLPGLLGILEDMVRGRNIELPLPTRVLMAINRFMISAGWWAVPLLVFGGIFGLIWLYKRPRGKAFLDEILMRMPVLGKLFRMIDTARFSRNLSVLLEAGVDIGGSLDLTAKTLMLVPLRRAVTHCGDAVMEGSELSDALEGTHRFGRDVVAIVQSGEETGKLPESLDRMADDYEERVELMVKNLGSLIQPLIFLILGGIVLFIALAFFSVYIMLLTGIM